MFNKEGNCLGLSFGQQFQFKQIHMSDIIYCIKVRPILVIFWPTNDIKFEDKNDHTVDEYW